MGYNNTNERDDIVKKLTMIIIFVLSILLTGCGRTIIYGGEL